ncbi:M48 family metallopeptidase [Marinobacterium sp. D7]|uniref:M48 family metallopeptidase n=1 Tax=Marinobacterium ramblicola TaxID=2849041 RepID=UPI001C2DCF9E|nr:SprT family zinc-dependent metalloprotease [Marinobacterium ramblicola]MBV1789551.1 M48 family metallopeptidase [Marinobacterium ramblicola]
MAPELPFSYQVVRSRRRRTASLVIDMGCVEVRVPALVDALWVDNWVRSKADWIVPRLESQTRALERHAIVIEQGGRFILEGVDFTLGWCRGAKSDVAVSGSQVQLTLSSRIRKDETDAVRELLKRWMVGVAGQRLVARCRELGEQCGLQPSAVQVRDYRRKWGQCNVRGEISLNWRLLHLSPEQRDYVLIHELCHLREMNHGRRFWALVARHCPDYRQYRSALSAAYPYLIW